MKIRFIFIRHGQGCHNIISGLNKSGFLRYNDALNLSGQGPNKELALIDPQLTNVGIHVTKRNAKVLKKVLEDRNINNIDLIVSSPLIRTIETAYYTKGVFGDDGSKKRIHVAPFLREVDESSKNPKSTKSREVIDTIPSYAMKPLSVQQAYFNEEGILNHISFNYLDLHLRREPGDIRDFINWFLSSRLYKKMTSGQDELNILVFTHAGVLKNFNNEGYYNNSGFIVEVNELGHELGRESLLKDMKNNSLFTEYHELDPSTYCDKNTEPDNGRVQSRCGQLCNMLLSSPKEKR